MKIGAVLNASISILKIIIEQKKKANFTLRNYVKENRYIGSKDKKLLYSTVFQFLKNYFTLRKICKENSVQFSERNGVLINFFSKNREAILDDIYYGKYSLKPVYLDKKIFNIAISYKDKILPSLPDWLADKLNIENKKKILDIYKSILLESRVDLRINTLNVSRFEVIKTLKNYGIEAFFTKFSPVGITLEKKIQKNQLTKINKNYFEIQDEGSQLVTLLSGIKPNLKVLDFCAGKGTKTLALHNEMKSKGELFVHDINKKRINFLKERAAKAKINIIKVLKEPDKYKNYFDLILIDVPCTGSGIWRRRPEDLIKLNKEIFIELINIQYKILLQASKLCKENGIISYITCSLFEDENEKQINTFLLKNKNFKKIDLFNKNLLNENNFFKKKKYLTINPSDINSDGFFICTLKKIN